MSIEIGLLISVASILLGYYGFRRNEKNDAKQETKNETDKVKEEATRSAVIETKLDTISRGIEDIRVDMRASEKQVASITSNQVRQDESLKSAHKRIDAMEKKLETVDSEIKHVDSKVNNIVMGVKV